MRRSERALPDMDMPTRYAVDEARFCGGRDRINNEEECP